MQSTFLLPAMALTRLAAPLLPCAATFAATGGNNNFVKCAALMDSLCGACCILLCSLCCIRRCKRSRQSKLCSISGETRDDGRSRNSQNNNCGRRTKAAAAQVCCNAVHTVVHAAPCNYTAQYTCTRHSVYVGRVTAVERLNRHLSHCGTGAHPICLVRSTDSRPM